jgi:hypothetical protein
VGRKDNLHAYLLGFLILNVLAGEYVSFDVSTTNKKIFKGLSRKIPLGIGSEQKESLRMGFLTKNTRPLS